MKIGEGLEILIKDWHGLHEDGGTKVTVEEIVGRLGNRGRDAVPPGLSPEQTAELIMNELRTMPGALESAKKFMAQFDSAQGLLEEMDLDCLVSDLTAFDDDF